MNDRRLVASSARLAAVLLLAAACTAGPSPSPSPSPTPSPGPTLTAAQLRYALLDRFGQLSWCDPDFYPIGHEDEQVLANQRIAEIRSDADTYAAILDRLAIARDAELSDAQVLAVYRDWKLLNAVTLTALGDGAYGYDLVFVKDEGLGAGTRHAGTIGADGTISSSLDEDTFLVSCPICLSRGTMIDTPAGPLPVESLRVGDLVWTLDGDGRRVAAPLVRTGSVAVPASHRVVEVVLDDGRMVLVSPGHRLADGRPVGDLRPGDTVDGATVVSAELVGYDGGRTFDLLPAGTSGVYWANGILLASTLR
jgi:hypothetical protein